MTTVKLYATKKDIRKDGKVSVSIRLTHDRKQMYIPIEVSVDAKSFDFKTCRCTKNHQNQYVYNGILSTKQSIAENAILAISNRVFTPDSLRELLEWQLKTGGGPATLKQISTEMIEAQRKLNKTGNADYLENVVKWFEAWINKDLKAPKEIQLIDIDFKRLTDYKNYLLSERKVSPTTVNSYFRSLRTVFNYAIKRKMFQRDNYPFEAGLIPTPETGKQYDFKIDIIQKLEVTRHTLVGNMRKVCNFTLLQFYFQGCDFVDLAISRRIQLTNGYFIFKRYKNRSKPNQPEVKIKVTSKAQEILDEYAGDLLIPILNNFPVINGLVDIENWKAQYKTRYHNFLRTQKELNKLTGFKISSKSMRYLWLTVSENAEISDNIRKLAVGHKIAGMTTRYTNYDQQRIDSANEKIQALTNVTAN